MHKKWYWSSLAIAFLLIILISGVVYADTPAPLKLPPVPVKAVVLNCSFQSGWCSKDSSVRIIAEDPSLPIFAIAGTKNGIGFYCDGSCSLSLSMGGNSFIYWSISPSGESSEIKALSVYLSQPSPRSVVRDTQDIQVNLANRSLSIVAFEQIVLNQYKTVVNPGSTIQDPDSCKTIKANGVVGPYSPFNMDTPPLSWEKIGVNSEKIYQTLCHAQMFITPFFTGKESSLTDTSIITDSPISEKKNFSALTVFTEDLEKSILFTGKNRQMYSFKKPDSSPLIVVKEEYSAILDDSAPQVSIEKQKSINGKIEFTGFVFEHVSDISSLMINVGNGWQPVPYKKNQWAITWDTERDNISGGEYLIQVRSRDMAGNETIQNQKVTVINRFWPLAALWTLVVMLGLVALFDPRRKSWTELAYTLKQGIALQKLDLREKRE